MSTRSITHIHDGAAADPILLTMYRHSDGYPEGHGKDLAAFLNGFKVVNGLSGDEGKVANGMPCLAAQIIAHFKDGPGQIYIYKAGSNDVGEQYEYHVSLGAEVIQQEKPFRKTHHTVELSCAESGGSELFSGTPADFPAYLAKVAAEVE